MLDKKDHTKTGFFIKKLDIYIVRNFCLLFAGTFFVCLFVFMMQFLWRYIDDLIGKGLTFEVMIKFFYYSGLTLIPMSLPLAILLAALISFGNMGERLELLAIRAAGIPLIQVFRPLIIIVCMLAGMSFYFQNVVGPASYIKLYTLLWSMKQTSPELEIPEGAFYNEIQGYNLYVKHKNPETGMLYDVTIYSLTEGFENARIILADSGRLDISANQQHLILNLYHGEQFENLQSMNSGDIHVPYRRETFHHKQTIINFNGGFQIQDADFLSGNSATKGMVKIQRDIDSMNVRIDSTGTAYYKELNQTLIKTDRGADSSFDQSDPDQPTEVKSTTPKQLAIVPFDTLYQRVMDKNQAEVIQQAIRRADEASKDLEFKELVIKENKKTIARHWAEWHRKITLSLACIIFFLIGASLGAIIRKGGLGMPVIISVIIFIIYYILDNTAFRQVVDLHIPVWMGMWLSTAVLAPTGIFLTYKSNLDSAVFNVDAYARFFRKILGLRTNRAIILKEVIIVSPDYPAVSEKLNQLEQACTDYKNNSHLLKPPSYLQLFWRNTPDRAVEDISQLLEDIVEELSNSRRREIIDELTRFPILSKHEHTSPFGKRWKNALAGAILPVGIFLYFRIWRFRIRLLQDMKQITKSKDVIQRQIEKINEKITDITDGNQ